MSAKVIKEYHKSIEEFIKTCGFPPEQLIFIRQADGNFSERLKQKALKHFICNVAYQGKEYLIDECLLMLKKDVEVVNETKQ